MKIKDIHRSKQQLPGYSDSRAEVSAVLVNLSNEKSVIRDGERISRMVIAKHEQAEWKNVDTLVESDRKNGGFGHTGKS